jgi:N-acetylglucosaminyldiphosphoundecaprenol N-acetyl-beta-D-mannosaminyltransferase
MSYQTGQKQAMFLGVRVSGSPRPVLLKKIAWQLGTKYKSVIFTPNPEILLESYRDPELRKILNSADFSIADGVGLKLASVLTQQGSQLPIIPGRLLMVDLLAIAEERKLRVYFLGATGRVIKLVLDRVKMEYPSVIARGNSGPLVDGKGVPKSANDITLNKKVLQEIKAFRPDILFVAFGAPKQEYWIASNLNTIYANLVMSVGGSLDYFSRTKQLPPEWMEKLGLEWLWRSLNEKGHAKRAFKAVMVFPLVVIFDRLVHGYRKI